MTEMPDETTEANPADVAEQQQPVPDHAGPDLDRLDRDLGDGSAADVQEQSQD